MPSYYGATDEYVVRHGTPNCSKCGGKMFPVDDHGRFMCTCSMGVVHDVISGRTLIPPPIPQVDTTGMPDAEKAQIPTILRLNDTPTAAEAGMMKLLMHGMSGDPNCEIGSPAYQAAQAALEKERNGL